MWRKNWENVHITIIHENYVLSFTWLIYVI